MTRPLTVHNAQITTAAVEVKTLTISGKQVTLAVFRQLREEPLIAEDGTLNGVPWGTVNYHPDKCGNGDYTDHWHVIWQRGSELLRSWVEVTPHWPLFCPVEGVWLLSAHVRAVLAGMPSRFWGGEIPALNDDRLIDKLDGVRTAIAPSAAACSAVTARADYLRAEERRNGDDPDRRISFDDERGHSRYEPWSIAEPLLQGRINAAMASIDQEIGGQNRERAPEFIFAKYKSAVAAEAARRERHHEVRKAIGDLPQLFIAV